MTRLANVVALCAAAVVAGCTSSGGTPAPGPSATPPGTGPASSSAASPTVRPTVSPTAPSATTQPDTQADWPMYHRTLDRAGIAPDLPRVTRTPTVLASVKLDGQVYASPVIVGGTIVAATENDSVYALTPQGRQLWKRNLGSPSPSGERPCGNIDPLGITGTPIVSDGTVYVAPEFRGARHELFALDFGTGAVRWHRSLDLPGVEAAAMQERGALTIAGGRVWVPFGGLAGDCGGYKGRVVGYRTDGSGRPVSYTVPTEREAGIWTPPGPSVDGAGSLLVAVGNGASGEGDPYDHSDSVLRIGTDGSLVDSFSPTSWPTDNINDHDLGSQGPAIVGPWVFSAGKSGTGYVLRRNDLGGIGGEVSQATVCESYGGTAVVRRVVYVPCADGVRAVRIDKTGHLHLLWHVGSDSISGSAIVGGGRVWSLDQEAGVLHALDPRTGASREQVQVGTTSRFATPAVYGPDVVVPTLTGITVVTVS